MRNIARISRREIQAHRQIEIGLTASVPVQKEVDSLGHKEWVVDVYFAPVTGGPQSILKDILVAPTAKKLIGDIRQPVELHRSKQGKYTVVGRAKVVPSGAQMPDGSILEPNFHETKVNLADLGLLHIPDLDYEVGAVGDTAVGSGDVQPIKAWNAFGNQVMGEGVEEEDVPAELGLEPKKTTTTRHTIITIKPVGGIPEEGYVYGVGAVAAPYLKVVEHTE